MSGTSADGINVALVEISGAGFDTRFKLLAHREYPYPRPVRRAVLAAMNAGRASVADLARLNFLLGELYAAAVLATQKKVGVNVELVGCHGQTIYHQGEAAPYLGKKITATWQTGEGAVIAARVGAPVVSDFRPADMAAGGKGAPLVPFLDYLVYRDARVGRIVQNLGGIANLTAIPAGASPEDVVAFDTGPANMVIDGVMARLYGKPYDRDGRMAAKGKPLEAVLKLLLKHPFFRRK
ncbi:MAG: anhydro-N-acetylmuramic acid kinase, partial [Terriglobales bacterium]